MELQAKSIHETNFLIGATYCEIVMDGTYVQGTYHGVLKPQLIRTSLLHRSSWNGPFYKPKIIGVNNHRTFFLPSIHTHTCIHTFSFTSMIFCSSANVCASYSFSAAWLEDKSFNSLSTSSIFFCHRNIKDPS